jgi:hypothetical protein
MKNITSYLSLFLIMSITISCVSGKKQAGQNVVITPLSDTIRIHDGSIVYGLPRSVLNIVVELQRTIEIPGPYARYAGDLLGLDRVIRNENESWTVQSVSVKTNEELDPSELYVIESNTLFQTNMLGLKKQGLILDINPGIYLSAEDHVSINQADNNQFQVYDLGSDEYFQLQRDTAYKRVSVDSSFIRIPYIVEKKKKLSPDQLAEKAAKRLMEMRDGKHLILTGEANVFPQNEAVINEMNRMEKEYTELFTGKTITENRQYSFLIIPLREMAGKPVTFFRFSEQTGPKAASSSEGKSLTIEFSPEKKNKDIVMISKPASKSDEIVYDKLFYRVPEVVNVKIDMGSETLFSSRRLIYQFGQVVQLPANYLIGK